MFKKGKSDIIMGRYSQKINIINLCLFEAVLFGTYVEYKMV